MLGRDGREAEGTGLLIQTRRTMKTAFHSAALVFSDTILHHWHTLTGKHYGKQARTRPPRVAA